MTKNWIMLAGLLFLGSAETSQGHPLDAADIVYVDGLPCNRACQSYLAWVRHLTLSRAERPVEPASVEPAPVEAAPEKPVLRSASPAISHAKAVHRASSKPAVARIAKQAAPLRPAKIEKPQPVGDATASSEPAPVTVAALPPEDGAATSRTRTVQEQLRPQPRSPSR
jgi:hypothetical protein